MGKTPATLDLQRNRMDFAVTERLQNRKHPEIYYSVKEMDSFLECKIYFGFPVLSILDVYPT